MNATRRGFLGLLGATALAPVLEKLLPTFNPPTLDAPQSSGRMTLTWSKVTDADYSHTRIYRSTSWDGHYEEVPVIYADKNRVEFEPAEKNKTYYYRVSAIDSRDKTKWS